jgi:hypothetical protein
MLVLLDIVVGVSFVYLLLALICTTANEWVASVRGLRGQTLDLGIRRMLGPLADDFFSHPLIASLSRPGKRPSYVPANLFSGAVLDLLGRHEDTAPPVQHVRAGLAALKKRTPAAADDHAEHVAALEEWFNNSMDRVSGWYKRRMQLIALLVGAGVAILTNADTLQIVSVLWRQPSLRADLVEQARQRLQGAAPAVAPGADRPASAEDDTSGETPANERSALDGIIGWGSDFRRINQGVCSSLRAERDRACAASAQSPECEAVLERIETEGRCSVDATDLLPTDASPRGAFLSSALVPVAGAHLLGWLLTAVAISLGSAFWFDTLNRFINIRGAGTAPDEKKKAGKV